MSAFEAGAGFNAYSETVRKFGSSLFDRGRPLLANWVRILFVPAICQLVFWLCMQEKSIRSLAHSDEKLKQTYAKHSPCYNPILTCFAIDLERFRLKELCLQKC